MKKILFVITALNAGGAEKSLINLLNLMDYEKYQVDLLLFKKEGAFLSQIPESVQLIDGPNSLHYLYNVSKLDSFNDIFVAINAILKKIIGCIYKKLFAKSTVGKGTQTRWDKIYKHNISNLAGHYDIAIAYMHLEPLYFVADKVDAKKKIGWIHIDYSELDVSRTVDEIYFSKFDKIATISDKCVDALKNDFPNLSEKFINLPNLTSSQVLHKMANDFYPDEYTKLKKETKILVSIGRLLPQKGFDWAIKAAKVLMDKGIDFTWFVIGQGELYKELQQQIQGNGLSRQFVLLGIRTNPYPYIINADVVVQPSRYEGKSIVLDEAKILAKPIVVTRYRTVVDQIKEGKEGIIVEMNPIDIARGVEELLANDKLRSRLSEYLAENNYDNSYEIKKYYAIMEN